MAGEYLPIETALAKHAKMRQTQTYILRGSIAQALITRQQNVGKTRALIYYPLLQRLTDVFFYSMARQMIIITI